MNWNQPMCSECWREANPYHEPAVMIEADTEECCMCGVTTRSGIYVRRDPGSVPFPTRDEET